MKIILIASLLLFTVCLHAQDTAKHTITINTDSFTSVQVEARFPGGQEGWRAFLEEHIHPKVPGKHKAPPGNYTVTISFLVDKEGKVSNVQVLNDPGYGTAEDVLKAFKHTPDWLPATISGKPVVYRQKQNITYQVTEK
jgi:protein TonB